MMRRFHRIASLLLTLVLVWGCAGSGGLTKSYDESADETIYRSGTISMGQISSGGYGSNTSLRMRAVSQCSGEDCVPESVTLNFSAEGGTSDAGLSGQRLLSVSADGEEYEFEDDRQSGVVNQSTVQNMEGYLLTVTVPMSDLEQIATATSLDGTLGGISVNLSRAQSDLQEYLSAVKNPGEFAGDSS